MTAREKPEAGTAAPVAPPLPGQTAPQVDVPSAVQETGWGMVKMRPEAQAPAGQARPEDNADLFDNMPI